MGWTYGGGSEDVFTDFCPLLNEVCYAHRTCHDEVIKPFTGEIDERLDEFESFDDPEYDKVLHEWEKVVALIIQAAQLRRQGLSIRKIASELNTTRYRVHEILKRLESVR